MFWQTTRFRIDLSHPQVMGIVNVTPDSFSDGGQHANVRTALAHCEQLLQEGAHILDIGGESTRPGAPAVTLEEELARVLPVVREAVRFNVPISVDTYKPAVMRAVLDAGADIINDVWALRQGDAQQVVASHAQCGVCLMHMHGEPQTMQTLPMQGAAIEPVVAFLKHQAHAALVGGQVRNFAAIELHRALQLQWQQPFGHAGQRARYCREHRAFAAATRAHEREDFAGRHMQVQAAHQRLAITAQALDVNVQAILWGVGHGVAFMGTIFSNRRGLPSHAASAKTAMGKSICSAA